MAGLNSWLVAHGPDTTVDMLARLTIESGRDWRSPERLRIPAPARRSGALYSEAGLNEACKLTEVCGFSMCHVCGGNDIYDAPFTCGDAS
ncbi:hypothetical protein [Martelella sp. AMO21009]